MEQVLLVDESGKRSNAYIDSPWLKKNVRRDMIKDWAQISFAAVGTISICFTLWFALRTRKASK